MFFISFDFFALKTQSLTFILPNFTAQAPIRKRQRFEPRKKTLVSKPKPKTPTQEEEVIDVDKITSDSDSGRENMEEVSLLSTLRALD